MPGVPNPLDAAAWYEAARDANGAMVWQNDGDDQLVTSLTFTLADVYPGAKYADTCISEIQVLIQAQ